MYRYRPQTRKRLPQLRFHRQPCLLNIFGDQQNRRQAVTNGGQSAGKRLGDFSGMLHPGAIAGDGPKDCPQIHTAGTPAAVLERAIALQRPRRLAHDRQHWNRAGI
ncbi:Uncharacterised protein [Mycobacteroides abscessus subsp. abscessus]|nr:Uncharacterised protein [Mycobacteroides abscessus subsp. abscessus]